MNKIKRLHIVLACFLLLVVLAVGMISPAFMPIMARAASGTEYSDVLMDLRKDSDFKESDYPIVAGDYAVNVIQVAESVNGELFVYVYQPNVSGITVTSLNMATKPNEFQAGDIKNYKLRLLSISGALAKYVVRDFKVCSEDIRYYNIISVFRKWVDGVDTDDGNGNDIYEVPYEVGKLYTAQKVGAEITYECLAMETITVTDKYVGYLRFRGGMGTFTDSHYVAFSTDYNIDKLMEADVYFVQQDYYYRSSLIGGDRYEYKDSVEKYAFLTCEEQSSNKAYFSWYKHTWNQIQSVSEFGKENNLTDEAQQAIGGKQWVLRFVETEGTYVSEIAYTEWGTKVSEVTILRLKFETDGKVYNLGVVDNKQSPAPDQKPDNVQGNLPKKESSFWDWLKGVWNSIVDFFTGHSNWWVYLLVVGLAVILLPTILGLLIPSVGKFLFGILKTVGSALWWIITAPFKGIAWLFRKIRGE